MKLKFKNVVRCVLFHMSQKFNLYKHIYYGPKADGYTFCWRKPFSITPSIMRVFVEQLLGSAK